MEMMQTLAQPFALSKATAAKQRKVNARMDAFNEGWSKHLAEMEKLRELEITKTNAHNIAEVSVQRGREKLLLIVEAKDIRAEIAEIFSDYEPDLAAARNAALAAHEEAQADVRRKLIEIGYIEGALADSVYPSITPGMIQNHPRVFELRRQTDALQSASVHDGRKVNEAALEKLTAEIEKIRAELLRPGAR